MVKIFEAWNGSNADLSNVLDWSLQNDPCADWFGCDCGYYNGSNSQSWVPTQDVTSIL